MHQNLELLRAQHLFLSYPLTESTNLNRFHRIRHVYQDVTGWPWFEPTLSRIEKISRFDLWKFAMEIRPEWYQHDTAALSRLIERLYRRRSSVRDLVDKFRMSSINPFPQWNETEELRQ